MDSYRDLIKHIRPEAFRRLLKREGWEYNSSAYTWECWKKERGEETRFCTFATQYFGPDSVKEDWRTKEDIVFLASLLNWDKNELISQLLDYSFQVYAELEDVVQRVSSYGSAGGLSVNEVLPDVFESKLRWAIDYAAESATAARSPEKGNVNE